MPRPHAAAESPHRDTHETTIAPPRSPRRDRPCPELTQGTGESGGIAPGVSRSSGLILVGITRAPKRSSDVVPLCGYPCKVGYFYNEQRKDDEPHIPRFSPVIFFGRGLGFPTAAIIAVRCVRKNANGCWSPTRQVRIDASTGTGSIARGMTFCTGTMFMGINLPEMLTQQCTRQ